MSNKNKKWNCWHILKKRFCCNSKNNHHINTWDVNSVQNFDGVKVIENSGYLKQVYFNSFWW